MCQEYSQLHVSVLIHADVTQDELILITAVKRNSSDSNVTAHKIILTGLSLLSAFVLYAV